MTDKNLTHIDFILDRSGSMQSCKTDTEGGFNTYIVDQKTTPGKCKVALHQFDDQYETVYSDVPIKKVEPLVLVPRGMTALLDAIGKTIVAKGQQLASLPEAKRPGTVIIAILTDGGENSSREYTYDSVKKLIKTQQDQYNWIFVFLGANQDAVLTGSRMGIARGQTITYDTNATMDTFSTLSASTTNYRMASMAGASASDTLIAGAFTEADRKKAMGEKDNKTVTSKV